MTRINYEDWEERKFVIARLRLDTQNLRLGTQRGILSPRSIISYMFDYERVIFLARAIALKGYFVNEMPIVVQEGGHYVVIEGNRRMTACKVLLDPSLAPAKHQAQIKYLASTFNTDSLRKIKCVIAPSRDDARVIIQNRHTGGSQIEKWDGMKQDTWYINDVTKGFSVDEIAQIYLQPKGKVLHSILRYKLYAETKQLSGLSDKAFRFVHGDEDFPISTLWRFGANKKGISFLGLEYTASGDIKLLLPPEEYNKRFAAIIEDLQKGSKKERAKSRNKEGINSRELNTEQDITKYLEGLESSGQFDMSIVPEPADSDSIDINDLSADDSDESSDDVIDFRFDKEGGESAEDNSEGASVSERNGTEPSPTEEENLPSSLSKRRKPKKPTSTQPPLISGAFNCRTTIPRIDEIFDELKEISLDKPNAIAVLFRTLMDLLMTRYVEQKGLLDRVKTTQIQEYITSNRKIEENLIKYLKTRHGIDETPEDIKRQLRLKEQLTDRWSPSLGLMLKFFDDNAIELIGHASLREAFKNYVRQQATVTHSEFNAFVHNPFFLPNATVLQEFWSSFAPFIMFLIEGVGGTEEATDAE